MLKQIGIAVIGAALLAGCGSDGKSEHDHHAGMPHGGKVEKEDEGTSVEISKKDVPAPVLAGFIKAFPDATIEEIEKETYKDGTIHYEFEYKDKIGKEHDAELNAEGEVLEDD